MDKKIITVLDVMTEVVISIEATAKVSDAVELMRQHNTSSIVVERRDDADEFGMITVRDIASEVLAKNLSSERINVYEIMSKPVLALDGDMNVVFAVRMLSRFQLNRALVTGTDRKPIGIVTLRDMVLRSLETENTAEC